MAFENSNEFTDWLYNRFVEASRKDNIVKAFIFLDVLRVYIEMVLHARNKADIAGQWNNPLITFDSWFRLATGVNTVITEHGSKLLKSKRFSDELFDGYYAFFTIDCMVKYAEKERKDSNFYHMVIALFSYER